MPLCAFVRFEITVWQAIRLAERARTMVLATATPVQLHPMELWDLLAVLSVGNPQVLGTELARWREASSPDMFEILIGRVRPDGAYAKWEWWKDPLPREEDRDVFRLIRSTLGMSATADTATNADFDRIDPFDQGPRSSRFEGSQSIHDPGHQAISRSP